MAENYKFSPEEVESVLKKFTNEDQFQQYSQNKDLILNLCNGYQSPLLEFTSKAKAELVQLIAERKMKQLPVDAESIMEGRTIPNGRTVDDERNRIQRVISALDAGEDPTKYKAKVRVKLGDPDAAGRQAIIADMSFPRKELVVAEKVKLDDVTIHFDEKQINDLKTVGRLNAAIDGVDSNGVVHSFIVAKDPDLNSIRFLDQKKVVIPKYVYGVELIDHTREELKAGKIAEFEIKAKGEVKKVQGYFDPVTYKIKFTPDAKNQILRTEETQIKINQMNQEATEKKTTRKKTEPSAALKEVMTEKTTKTAKKDSQKQTQKRNQGQSL